MRCVMGSMQSRTGGISFEDCPRRAGRFAGTCLGHRIMRRVFTHHKLKLCLALASCTDCLFGWT